MKVLKIISVVLMMALLAGPALAQLNFNWVYEPGGYGNMVHHQPMVMQDGRVAANVGGPMYATWAGPPAPNHDFTRTALGFPSGVTGINEMSGINSNNYFVISKDYGDDSIRGAWAYTQVGWTRLVDDINYRREAADQCEDYAVIGGSQQHTIWTIPLNGAGAPVATTLPNLLSAEPGSGRISDSGEYIIHSDGGWANGARLSYGADWNSYTDLPSAMRIATDVNNDGDAIGIGDLASGYEALYYDHSAGTVSAIPFGTGWDANWNQLRADGMNNHGDVVGRIRDKDEPSGNKSEGLFFYDRSENTTTWLWDLVDDEHPSVPTPHEGWGWAHSINDDGWIAGASYADTPSDGADAQCIWLLTKETAPPVPKNRGDVTEDLFVGADDLVRILTHWGESGPAVTWSDGDCAPYGDGITTGDQFVGADDYVEVLSMWGTSYPAEPTPTPEPATLGLLLLGGLLGIVRRK